MDPDRYLDRHQNLITWSLVSKSVHKSLSNTIRCDTGIALKN